MCALQSSSGVHSADDVMKVRRRRMWSDVIDCGLDVMDATVTDRGCRPLTAVPVGRLSALTSGHRPAASQELLVLWTPLTSESRLDSGSVHCVESAKDCGKRSETAADSI